ncbi:MAG: hypothetical protein WAU07_05205, partial [Microgenomates group bacterium]
MQELLEENTATERTSMLLGRIERILDLPQFNEQEPTEKIIAEFFHLVKEEFASSKPTLDELKAMMQVDKRIALVIIFLLDDLESIDEELVLLIAESGFMDDLLTKIEFVRAKLPGFIENRLIPYLIDETDNSSAVLHLAEKYRDQPMIETAIELLNKRHFASSIEGIFFWFARFNKLFSAEDAQRLYEWCLKNKNYYLVAEYLEYFPDADEDLICNKLINSFVHRRYLITNIQKFSTISPQLVADRILAAGFDEGLISLMEKGARVDIQALYEKYSATNRLSMVSGNLEHFVSLGWKKLYSEPEIDRESLIWNLQEFSDVD